MPIDQSDIDALLDEEDSLRARHSQMLAPSVDPDSMGRALQIGRDQSLPPIAVAENLGEFDERERLDRASGLALQNPAIGSWLSKPENAALSSDDHDNISKLDKVFRRAFQGEPSDAEQAKRRSAFPEGTHSASTGDNTSKVWGEYLTDLGLATRVGMRSGLTELVSAPKAAVNWINRGINADAQRLAGLFGKDAGPGIPLLDELLPFEDELRAAANKANQSDIARNQSARQGAIEANRPDGFLSSLSYYVQYPSLVASDISSAAGYMAAGGVVPGNTQATIVAQAMSQASGAVEQTRARLVEKGLSEDDAKAKAADVFGFSLAIGILAPKLIRGGQSVERAIGGEALDVGRSRALNFARPLAGETVSEGFEEGAIQFGQNVGAGDPAGQGVGGAAATGAVAGVGMSAPVAVAGALAETDKTPKSITSDQLNALLGDLTDDQLNRGRSLLDKLVPAAADADRLRELADSADKLKTKARDQASTEELLQGMADRDAGLPSTIYIDAAQAVEYFQSQGADPAASIAEITGNPDDLSTALMGSGDLTIPIGRFISSSGRESLMNLARTAPDRLSNADLSMFSMDDLAREFTAPVEESEADPESPQAQVEGALTEIISAAGRYSKADSAMHAKSLAVAYERRAGRLADGRTAFDLFMDDNLRITDEAPGAVGSRRAPVDAVLDPLIDDVLANGFDSRERPGSRHSLVQAVINAGGIDPDSVGVGDLRAAAGRMRPGVLVRGGLTAEAMAESFAEQDSPWTDLFQTKDAFGRPELNEFLEMLGDELRGGDPILENEQTSQFDSERDEVAAIMRRMEVDGANLSEMGRPALRSLVADRMGREYDQTAYHGTPATVDRFSLQKIGTGEGNQSFGYGLYFASLREVAEGYRKNLTGIAGQPGSAAAEAALEAAAGNRAEAISRLSRKGDAEAVEFLRRNVNRGKLYQVEVPEDSDLLDYDKPLSEQPEKVRKALSTIDPDQWSEAGDDYDANETGQSIYHRLVQSPAVMDAVASASSDRYLGALHQAASEALMAAGIPGLRYLDGSSRGTGDGSHNYVIWDEAAVSITQEFYQTAEQGVDFDESAYREPVVAWAKDRFGDATDPSGRPIWQNFTEWFGDSKVVDEAGKPLVVYHGTTADFTAFDLDYSGADGIPYSRPAIFASADPFIASEYADNKNDRDVGAAMRALEKGKRQRERALGRGQGSVGDDYETDYTAVKAAMQARDDRGGNRGIGGNVMPVFMRGNMAKFDAKGRHFMEVMPDAIKYADEGGFDGVIVDNVEDAASAASRYPATVVASFHPTSVKSATGNNGAFDGSNPSILYQSAETDPLVVVHNLTAENLLYAVKLGGLPAPSIGIAKADQPFDGYGEITLIGRQHLAEPGSDNPVFSTDAWTQRFPDLIWSRVPSKKAESFLKGFGESFSERDTDEVWDSLVNNPNRDRAAEVGEKSATFMRAWLKSQGEVPAGGVATKVSVPSDAPWAEAGEWVEFVQNNIDEIRNARPGDAMWTQASTVARNAADQWVAALDADVKAVIRKQVDRSFDDDGIAFGPGDRAITYAYMLGRELESPTVDAYATRNALAEQIGDRRPEFNRWVFEVITDQFDEPKIQLGRKKVPVTLDNVVKAMTGKGVAGQEKSLTFGAGKAAAANSKRYKSIDEIKADRSRIVSPEDHKAAKESSGKVIDSFQDAILPFSTIKNWRGEIGTWDSLDASMKALADAGKKAATPANARRALERNGFSDVDDDAVALAVSALNELRSIVVDYLEAKPQRAVSLSEFAGAVIPSDASQEVRSALDDAGIEIQEYSGSDPSARAGAVSTLSRRLNDAGAEVLFQKANASIQFDELGALIRLGATANLSSLHHESGQLFLDWLMRDAFIDGADPTLAADLDAFLESRGKSVRVADGPAAVRAAIEVADHEAFAEGYETYLFEGKAPTLALADLFARFRSWMLAVYGAMRARKVPISDEMRRVYDRLYAADAEAEAASQDSGYQPLPDNVAGLVSDARWQAYQKKLQRARDDTSSRLSASVLAPIYREGTAEFREAVEAMETVVLAEAMQDKAHRARSILANGKLPDGSDADIDMAMDGPALKAEFGEQYVMGRLKGLYRNKDGQPPALVADLLGFRSSMDLVEALANTPPIKVWVKAEADRRVRAERTDPATDGTLPAKALEAVHRSKRLDALDDELAMVAELGGKPAPPAKALGALARRMVAAIPLRNLRPNDYLQAERKAANEAMRHLSKAEPNLAGALTAKRRQAMSAHLYRAALDRKESAEKAYRFLSRFNKTKKRQQLGKVGGQYLEQIDALMESLGLRPASAPEMKRRQSLLEFVRAAESRGEVVSVHPRLIEQAERINVRDLTGEQLQGIVDTVRQINHLAVTKGRLLALGEKRRLVETDSAIAASIMEAYGGQPPTSGSITQREALRELKNKFLTVYLSPSNLARDLDGGRDGGPVWESVIRPIQEASNRTQVALQEQDIRIAEIYRKHYTAAELRGLRVAHIRAPDGSLWSRERVLALAGNRGNPGNMEAIFGQERVQMTPEIVDFLMSKMDARDWQAVQDLAGEFERVWPLVAEHEKIKTGLVPERVEFSPFTVETSDGKTLELPGWYWPLVAESHSTRGTKRSKENEAQDLMDALRTGRSARAQTRNGSAIERVGFGGQTVKLDLMVVQRKLRESIRDVNLGPAVNDVYKVLSGRRLDRQSKLAGLDLHVDALKLWLTDIAAGEMGPQSIDEQAVRFFRANATTAVMGFKLGTAVIQPTGFAQSIPVVGAAWMGKGLKRVSEMGMGAFDYVDEVSPGMKLRGQGHVEQIHSVNNSLSGSRLDLKKHAWWMMARSQRIVDVVTFLAAEAKGLDLFDNDVEKARAYAFDAVERSQASNDFIGKNALQRGTTSLNTRQSEWVKASTFMMSYMMAKGQLVYLATKDANFKNPKSVMAWTATMVNIFVWEALAMAVRNGGLPGDDDDDGWLDDFSWWLAGEVAESGLGTLPGGNYLASTSRGFTPTTTGADAAEALGRLLNSEDEDPESVSKAQVKALSGALGAFFGFPSGQLNVLIDALYRQHGGEDVSARDYVLRPADDRTVEEVLGEEFGVGSSR